LSRRDSARLSLQGSIDEPISDPLRHVRARRQSSRSSLFAGLMLVGRLGPPPSPPALRWPVTRRFITLKWIHMRISLLRQCLGGYRGRRTRLSKTTWQRSRNIQIPLYRTSRNFAAETNGSCTLQGGPPNQWANPETYKFPQRLTHHLATPPAVKAEFRPSFKCLILRGEPAREISRASGAP
jgi:hypothetical protein